MFFSSTYYYTDLKILAKDYMPLPISHALLGASIVAAIHPQPDKRRYMPLFIGAFLANAVDFDFGLVFLFHSREWHRGFSHSLFFALIVCLTFILFFGKNHLQESIAYGLAFASHCVLDFVTTKEGGGLELLFPFSTERIGLRWFGLSEVLSLLPNMEILKALFIEFIIFAPILLATLYARKLIARKADKTSEAI